MNTVNYLEKMPDCMTKEMPYSELSNKYKHYNTYNVVQTLGKNGWLPVSYSVRNTRKESKKGFQKHLIRFRHESLLESNASDIPELIIINSHDGSCSFQIMFGIFRMACANGLIVADQMFQSYKIRHSKFTEQEVIETTCKVLEQSQDLMTQVENFKETQLEHHDLVNFARYGSNIRMEQKLPFDQVLKIRREEDGTDDLWTIYNRIQENIIEGGLEYKTKNKKQEEITRKTKKIRSIDTIVKLNLLLWQYAIVLFKGKRGLI